MPDRVVFLDAIGWIALLNSSDALHRVADACWKDLIHQGASFLLSEWIVAETGNGLARSQARKRFPQAVELLRSSPRAELLPVSRDLFDRSLGLYANRPDKTWGLVDCASFLIMEERGIREAFTNDRHFLQAGFSCLLPLSSDL